MKKVWEAAYEDYLNEQDNSEIVEMDRLIDSKLKKLLTEKDFEEIFNLTSKVQALIEENAFKAGYEWLNKIKEGDTSASSQHKPIAGSHGQCSDEPKRTCRTGRNE